MPTPQILTPPRPATPTSSRAPGTLTALLDEVAATHLDAPTWEVLSRRARAETAALAAAGTVPAGLVVAAGDPPVVVARVLQVAARIAAATPVVATRRCA